MQLTSLGFELQFGGFRFIILREGLSRFLVWYLTHTATKASGTSMKQNSTTVLCHVLQEVF